jgi:hypothetical protein
MLQVSGFRLQASGFRFSGLKISFFYFRLQASGFRLQASSFMLQTSGFRVEVSGFRRQGSGSRVKPIEGGQLTLSTINAPVGEISANRRRERRQHLDGRASHTCWIQGFSAREMTLFVPRDTANAHSNVSICGVQDSEGSLVA